MGLPMGTFEVLLELLDMHLQRPGGAPVTARATSRGGTVFIRTEAVTALRLMIGCSGRDPLQFTLHSGRIGGGGAPSYRHKVFRRCNFSAQEDGSLGLL